MAEEKQKDLELLEKVMMRLAMAKDDQLEKQIQSLLVPVLGKLMSSHEEIKKKVLEVLGHINKRVKPLPTIKLPLADLVEQFLDPNSTAFLLNFNILYLEMGFGRCTIEEQCSYVPKLLLNLSKRTTSQQDSVLHMILSVIEKVPVPDDEEQRTNKFEFSKNFQDTALLLDFFLDTLLATPINSKNPEEVPPGHSQKSYQRIISKLGKSGDQLRERKIAILDFLTKSRIISDSNVLPLFIVASCDAHHTVVRKGEDGLKRIKLELEDKMVIAKLFSLFQGSISKDPNVPKETQRLPAHPILKTKLVNYFSRSTIAANSFPNTLQIIFDCVYGDSTTVRLKSAAMGFVQWVFRQATDVQLNTMAPVILSGLLKFLDQLKDEVSSSDTNELKSFTYSAIGLLAKRIPSLFQKDLSVLSLFFLNLSTEETRVKAAIQDGLVMLCQAYVNSSDEIKYLILQLLLENVEKNDYQARYISIYFANRIFPFDHPPSRYLCLLCVEDFKLEVKEEAHRGLRPFLFKDGDIIPDSNQPYPSFISMVEELMENSLKKKEKIPKKTTGKSELVYGSIVYEEMLKFLRTCLKVSATVKDVHVKQYVTDLLSDSQNRVSVENYLKFLDDAIDPSKPELHHVAIESFLHILSYQPDEIGKLYASRHEWLLPFLYSGGHETRKLVGRILGLLSPFLDVKNVLIPLIKELTIQVPSILGFDKQYGGLNGLGYILGRCIQRGIQLPHDLIVNALFEIYQTIDHSTHSLGVAAIQAIGAISRYAPLPLPEGETLEEGETKTKKVTEKQKLNKKTIVYQLIKVLSSSESKLIEASAQTLANMSLGERGATFDEIAIQGLFETGSNKNEEVHFTVGECLTCIGAGWNSDAAVDPITDDITIDGKNVITPMEEENKPKDKMQQILTLVLTKELQNLRHRSAACIWLLSMVKNVGKHSAIRTHLSSIQTVFSYLLSDSDEVIQEVASKGLVFVYENGDEKTKKELVSGLMETLSSGKKSGFKVEGETTLFPEGSLPGLGKAPDGSTVNTYKELCNLATEMGKPELVYKFLNLASHHSMWNSRKGAAFAATGILSQAKDQLKSYLPSLVPKLYRYSYDPNPRIAQSMGSILGALVDIKKATTEYFKGIITELLESIGSSLWRVREGSCSALSDLLQGRTFDEVEPYLADLWYKSFRAMDDIKESVRVTALSAVKSLSNLTTRLCDPTHTSAIKGKAALQIALPFLLQKGIVSDSEEVKKFSLNQILKLTKIAGFLLKPHIPELSFILLDGLSSLEPASFNYLSFHTEQMNLSQEQLEEARMAVSKNSTTSETLDLCIKYVDDENVEELSQKLIEVIKVGVGLPTRVGTAKFISSLSYSKATELKPHIGKLVIAMIPALKDRSITIRKAFAGAVANLAKYATTKTIKQLTQKLMEYYNQLEDEELRSASANTFLELARRAPEALKSSYSDVLPLIYMARHDPNEEISKVFKETWMDCAVGGPGLYLSEIIKKVLVGMESTSWILKKQAALTLKDLAESSGKELIAELEPIIKLLVNGFPGRLWKGKEALLSAVAAVCTSCRKEIEAGIGGESPTTLVILVAKECKKNDKDYKRQALNCLNSLLKTFDGIDLFEQVKDVLYEIVSEEEEPKGEGETTKDIDPKDKPLNLLIRGVAFQCLGNAWPSNYDTQAKNISFFQQLMVSNLSKNVWNVKVEILTSLKLFLQKTFITSEDPNKSPLLNESMVKDLLAALLETLGDAKYSVIRVNSLDLLGELITKTEGTNLLQPHLQELNKQLSTAASSDSTLQDKAERIKSQLVDHPSKKRKS